LNKEFARRIVMAGSIKIIVVHPYVFCTQRGTRETPRLAPRLGQGRRK
jgi:hypothetical protein